jgi:putative transcriptional regulator
MDGNVYFARAGRDGPIKVGWTSGDLKRRIAILQTGTPDRLEVVASMAGSTETERLVHAAHGPARRVGEWFNPTPALLELVDRITSAAAKSGEQRETAFQQIIEDLRVAAVTTEKEARLRSAARRTRSVNVRAIRRSFGLTQIEFARFFGFTMARIRDWEQRRCHPDGALRAYLIVIDRNPCAVIEALWGPCHLAKIPR